MSLICSRLIDINYICDEQDEQERAKERSGSLLDSIEDAEEADSVTLSLKSLFFK